MVLEATPLETALARALEKNPMNIRYHAVRLLAELNVGRSLTEKEIYRLVGKIQNSFPRVRPGGFKKWPDEETEFIAENYDSTREGVEILRILHRAGLTLGEGM